MRNFNYWVKDFIRSQFTLFINAWVEQSNIELNYFFRSRKGSIVSNGRMGTRGQKHEALQKESNWIDGGQLKSDNLEHNTTERWHDGPVTYYFDRLGIKWVDGTLLGRSKQLLTELFWKKDSNCFTQFQNYSKIFFSIFFYETKTKKKLWNNFARNFQIIL